MTEEEAIALSKTEFWKHLTHRQIAEFQLAEDRLCMPFDVFHEAIEKALGRPVWTHEFAFRDHLVQELFGERKPPTLTEMLALIPEEKRIVVAVPGEPKP